ncbi:MAG: hypothetical protein LAQ30_11650 [Acidobacteriia bacterium]|nr:hypothetical protein [Terriglobia bacterium]
MHTTRRDLFKFIGGSAVGALFTPAPWRLITDTALWSENWPGIPRPARGEIKTKFTNCALCPAGCGVRARCVGEQPVSLAGVASHPLSRGALCPFGLAGHHLPYHPERVKAGDAQGAAAAVREAVAKCAGNERIAVLDLRPGRTASWTYRRALAGVKNGLYVAAPQPLGGWAVDLAKARTVISFGVPVLDGWGTPGNVLQARANFRLVQVEPVQSRTAILADEWLQVEPDVAAATAIVKERAANGPVLVLADWPELLALNQPGETIAPRQEAPVPDSWKTAAPVTELSDVPNASIRALLIDESVPGAYIPWSEIETKLVRDNPMVVAFGPSRAGYGRHARFTIPTPVYPELTDDIPPAVDCPGTAFRVSAPLLPPPGGVVSPADFIAGLGGLDAANALRERADAIHKSGRGAVFTYADAKSTPVKELQPDDFWKALNEGACWIGNSATMPARSGRGPALPREPRPLGSGHQDSGFTVVFTGSQPGLLVSPILSKLYQESNLRLARNGAVLHPDSARSCGVEDGSRAFLETPLGQCAVEVALDPSVPPGFVQVAAGPEVLDICGASLRARVVRA